MLFARDDHGFLGSGGVCLLDNISGRTYVLPNLECLFLLSLGLEVVTKTGIEFLLGFISLLLLRLTLLDSFGFFLLLQDLRKFLEVLGCQPLHGFPVHRALLTRREAFEDASLPVLDRCLLRGYCLGNVIRLPLASSSWQNARLAPLGQCSFAFWSGPRCLSWRGFSMLYLGLFSLICKFSSIILGIDHADLGLKFSRAAVAT